MSANPQIPRPVVHALSEECADIGPNFSAAAKRLLEDQARLVRFFRQNLPAMEGQSGEVSMYLLAVIMRIFDRCGGKMGRISTSEIEAATKRILGEGKRILPFDEGFPARVREIEWRAQPHILDEALNALFEREERKSNEIAVDHNQAGRIFLMLWAATEALETGWRSPATPLWATEGADGAA